MRHYLLMFKCFLLVFVFLFGITSVPAFSQKAAKPLIKAVEIRDSSFLFGERFYRVYHSGPIVVYQSRYLSNSFVVRPRYDSVAQQEDLESNLKQSDWKSYYFVFHKDSSYGLRFDQEDRDYIQRFRVDSLLQTIRGTNNYEGVLAGKPDTVTWNENRTILKEVYVGKPQKDTLTASLVLYYSNRMNTTTESLNEKLDSARRLKLYRIEILTNQFYSKKDNQVWPAMKISSTLQEILVKNPNEVVRYINKYKSICAQNKEPAVGK